MKLIYYTATQNFGDGLNPMLFPSLLPGLFDEDETEVFYGIGSILQFDYRQAKKKHVFSTGFAYGKLPEIDDTFDIYAVRGPLTAKRIGVDPALGIGDGALLLRTQTFEQSPKQYPISYIPHHQSEELFDWEALCKEVGYHYISPCNTPEFVISEILSSELVLTEAMHGAILADTLRVPWVPVVTSPHINQFKWEDWSLTIGLDHAPHFITPLLNRASIFTRIENRIPVLGKTLSQVLTPVYQAYQQGTAYKKAVKEFANLRQARPRLSETVRLDTQVAKLMDQLDLFKKNLRIPQ
ncbi:MAG: polysaccharide pyruvyl transferase family protein [Bacteroidota bacterium]